MGVRAAEWIPSLLVTRAATDSIRRSIRVSPHEHDLLARRPVYSHPGHDGALCVQHVGLPGKNRATGDLLYLSGAVSFHALYGPLGHTSRINAPRGEVKGRSREVAA